jgi:YD repeat-containing protein
MYRDHSDFQPGLYEDKRGSESNHHNSALSEIYKLPGALSQGDRVMSKAPQLEMQDSVSKNRDGSEIRFDGQGRVTSIRDAKERVFSFQYDKQSCALIQLTNEYTTWHRQQQDGKYINEWKSDDNQVWSGELSVNSHGYSYRDHNQTTLYSSDGSKNIEYLNHNKEVVQRFKEDRFGNTSCEDLQTKKLTLTRHDGRSAIFDQSDNSLLAYDRAGNLTLMRDAAGKQYSFSNYDAGGKPQMVKNESGTWHYQGDHRWVNQDGRHTWFGDVAVDRKGIYTYTDLEGRKITHFKNGTVDTTEHGVTTRVAKNGSKAITFDQANGQDSHHNDVSVAFRVQNGVTTEGLLNLHGTMAKIRHGYSDVSARIASPDEAVTAAQGGRVVYSFNHLANANNSHANLRLGRQDLATIERYKLANPDSDVLVLECYDQKARGIRYQIYAGLSQATASEGEVIKAGQVMGRSGSEGYVYSVHRHKVSGPAVDLKLAELEQGGNKPIGSRQLQSSVEPRRQGELIS